MSRRLSLLAFLLAWSLPAFANLIPGPAVVDNIVACQGSTCTSLTGGPVNGPASFSGTINGGGTNYTINALADGTGGPGDLKVLSSYTLSGPSSFYSQIQSGVQYEDDLTITSSSQSTGSLGYLVIDMQINGTTTPSGLGSGVIVWQDSIGTNPLAADLASNCPINPQPGGCYFHGSASLTFNPIPFHYGDPFFLDFAIGAGTYPQPSFLSGSADYSHTAILTGMQVLDSNMNPISNPTFISAAGVQYSVNGVVPEPASLLLLGTGLLAIGALRFRKRWPTPPASVA